MFGLYRLGWTALLSFKCQCPANVTRIHQYLSHFSFRLRKLEKGH